MRGVVCLLSIACILGLSQEAFAEQGSELRFNENPVLLVANDWCPQHCESDESGLKGYIIDIVEGALEAEGVAYKIKYFPWVRALREVEQGRQDGLLTPTVAYTQFLFHEEAVGYQEYCVYTNKHSTFIYRTHADLLGKRIAFLKESGFGTLDTYLAEHKDEIRVNEFFGGQGYTVRIFEFLAANRTEAIIVTSDVYQFALKLKIIPDNFKVAGCLGAEKLAVGLSPVDKVRSQEIGKILDAGIRTLRQSGELSKIADRYGITLWLER